MQEKKALVIVDVQRDFCEHGSLAVPHASEIIPLINTLKSSPSYSLVVLTRDWHPATHCSFAVNNPGTQPFETIKNRRGEDQVMWPTHCVQGTEGAQFHPDLQVIASDVIVNKGLQVESYSGFGSSLEVTGLEEILRQHQIAEVHCCGLAFDYCVGSTAKDAARLGFKTVVIKEATRSIASETEKQMEEALAKADVKISCLHELA